MIKLKPTSQVNWTSLEFSRRIAENFVRYEFLPESEKLAVFDKLRKWVVDSGATLAEMRALSGAMSRNSTKAKRARIAKDLLGKLGYREAKMFVA